MTTLIPKFKQPFSGAVNIPINIKLEETVSVIDFGADPTGVADSYAAFLAAYNSGAGTIMIPLGEFKITQTLKLDRAVTFIGATNSGTRDFVTPTNATTVSFTGTGAAFECTATDGNGTRNFHFKSFHIKGTASGACGILLGNTAGAWATMSSVIDVQIRGFTAVDACGLHVNRAINCYFRNVATLFNYDGIKCLGNNTTLTFDSCWSTTNDRYGWLISDALATGNFMACISENNQSSGLRIEGDVIDCNFYGWHSEINCISTGLAPQVLTNNGAFHPRWINFYAGFFNDSVDSGAIRKTFDITGCYKITWFNPEMPDYNPGFMSVSSTTADCNFTTPVQGVYPSFITNNTNSGVAINNNAPIQYVKSMVINGLYPLNFTSGFLFVTDITNNQSAIFLLNGSANTVTIISDPSSHFATAYTVGKIAVYYGTGQYRIGNGVTGPVDVIIQSILGNIL